jgi:hypothetical protein
MPDETVEFACRTGCVLRPCHPGNCITEETLREAREALGHLRADTARQNRHEIMADAAEEQAARERKRHG